MLGVLLFFTVIVVVAIGNNAIFPVNLKKIYVTSHVVMGLFISNSVFFNVLIVGNNNNNNNQCDLGCV